VVSGGVDRRAACCVVARWFVCVLAMVRGRVVYVSYKTLYYHFLRLRVCYDYLCYDYACDTSDLAGRGPATC
jgi:hypothetical protein